ncbi:MAG: hypothetical protein LUD02_04625 [Tannerellaceae bacterium]|nr:hypothetical protein [Tannerellaceae bacterium]MCD8263526.1 hypothetical protein [Tannerellaceae bacterium]
MPVARQKELAALILAEYPVLKVSELLLFFHRLKCGRYGRFYGSVDALFISSALLSFTDEHKKELYRIKSEQQRDRQPQPTATHRGITYEEYLQLKQQKQDEEKSK